MKITMQYFTIIRDITKQKEEVVEMPAGTSVLKILEHLNEKYGNPFKRIVLSGSKFPGLKLLFLINGQNTETLDSLRTILKNGDVLSIVPPLSGG